MKYASFVEKKDYGKLEARVNKWMDENKDLILEIIDVELEEDAERGYCLTISYLD